MTRYGWTDKEAEIQAGVSAQRHYTRRQGQNTKQNRTKKPEKI